MELPLVRVARRWGLTWRVAVPTLLAAVLGVGSVAPLGGTLRPTPGVVLAAGCYLGGLLSLAVAAGSYARYRRAMATATTPTGAVEPGFVEVSGEAGPAGDPATTPFTGAAALCYDWRVEERRGDGWATVALDEGGAPFRVDDGSGPVVVDPAGADRRFDEERRVEVAADEAPPERVAAFLAAHPDLADGDRDRRYVERFLPPGAEAYVLGQARPAFAGEHAADLVVADERAGTHLVAAGTPAEVTVDGGDFVRVAGGAGLVAVGGGYAWLVVAAGVV